MSCAAGVAAPAGVDRPRRIGLFGGSFDPVHVGHRQLADCALAQLRLDELRWVVARQPWQKTRTLAPAADRAAMVEVAIADQARFRLERCELDRGGASYTIDTVEQLQRGEPAAQWFLVIGQDQYANLPSWHRWQDLVARVSLAVAARDAKQVAAPAALAATPHRCRPLVMPPVAVSSTALRAALQGGAPARQLVPAMLASGVAEYIERRGLYHAAPACPV